MEVCHDDRLDDDMENIEDSRELKVVLLLVLGVNISGESGKSSE